MARTTLEASGASQGFAVPDMSAARISAFGRAERHSRRVRVLKQLLPLAAMALVIGFAAYSWRSSPPATSLPSEGAGVSDGKLVMSNPKLEGFNKDGRPYTMTADRAIQAFDQQGIIDLEGINAKLPVGPEGWAMVKAVAGVYDRTGNTIDLKQDITVTTTDGMVATMQSASLDIGVGSMKSDEAVEIRVQGSTVTANSMQLLDNGKLIVFENRVKMITDAAKMKTMKTSGGTDASK